jgi:glycosyltransferase involved in cell wall biosynthesis
MPTNVASPGPKVSVIIPSYKTAELIAACLDSVLAQTFAGFEAIVVNDGSPDTPQLERVLEPYRERIVYIKQENKRAAGARNNAIQQARGEFVAFLDSDDSWRPNHLANQMAQFDANPSLGLVYANSLLVGVPGREIEFMEKCPSNGEATFESLLAERCQIPISTVVARKSVIVKAGMFDEKLLRCDDYDMWVRCAFYGAKIGYVRTVQAHMAIGRPGSLSQARVKMAEGYWTILDKYQRTLSLSEGQRWIVENRANEIRGRYLLEEGKCSLEQRQYDKARQFLSEANNYLRMSALSLAVFGLGIAPGMTARLISFWNRSRNGASA